MTTDEKYMMRCLQLAAYGAGSVSLNPMVGAVIVHNDRVLGEGFHRRIGGAHAEVNAVESVRDKELLAESTIYVSLEPCSHYGKTPPCAELIVKHRFRRVVVAMGDPNPKVSGRGIEMMRAAGIEVIAGVLEAEAMELNRMFIVNQTLRRPYVVLKWAQSADGFIDHERVPGDGQRAARISNDVSAVWVHRLRAELDGIMVGTNTALLDEPRLNVRLWHGDDPVRVVIDKRGVVATDNPIWGDGGRVIVLTELADYPARGGHVEAVVFDFEGRGVAGMLEELYERGVASLLVEGGAMLHQSFIESGWWDEAVVECSETLLGDGIAAPEIDLKEALAMELKGSVRYQLKNKNTQNII